MNIIKDKAVITTLEKNKAGHENSRENYFRQGGQGTLSVKVMLLFQQEPKEMLGETRQISGRSMLYSEALVTETS